MKNGEKEEWGEKQRRMRKGREEKREKTTIRNAAKKQKHVITLGSS